MSSVGVAKTGPRRGSGDDDEKEEKVEEERGAVGSMNGRRRDSGLGSREPMRGGRGSRATTPKKTLRKFCLKSSSVMVTVSD
jgi:hypothetical protein